MADQPGSIPKAAKGKGKAAQRSPSPYRSRGNGETTISEFVNEFWQHTVSTAENSNDDFKHQSLPLARIKKVMKSDPEVQMISSEVTVLFEKACQIFIQELTARSHLVSLSHKRRTLSRPDVAQAISKSDQFDFLIDIVPRDDDGEVAAHAGAGKKRKSGPSKKSKARSASIDVEGGDEDAEEERQVKRFRSEDGGGGEGPTMELPPMGILSHEEDEEVGEVELQEAIEALKHEAEQAEFANNNGHGNEGVDWGTGVETDFDYGHVGGPSFYNPNLNLPGN